MNGELYIIFCATLGCLLFALGGTEIPAFKTGFKWLRREVLPASWGILAYSSGIEWWRCLIMAVLFDIAFRLPYGDRTPKWLKSVVFIAMPLPSLLLGFNEWQLLSGILCLSMWALSNWKPTERIFEWVVSCLIIGFFIGITVGKLIAETM